MSHFLGPVRHDGRTFNQSSGLDLVPPAGPLGGPRFVLLHFDSVNLSAGATLTVDLGFGTDVFNASSGPDFWSRPVDGAVNPIRIRITGSTGSARLLEFEAVSPASHRGRRRARLSEAKPIPTRSCTPIRIKSRSSKRGSSATPASRFSRLRARFQPFQRPSRIA
jgi:hypothetical protein